MKLKIVSVNGQLFVCEQVVTYYHDYGIRVLELKNAFQIFINGNTVTVKNPAIFGASNDIKIWSPTNVIITDANKDIENAYLVAKASRKSGIAVASKLPNKEVK